MKILIAIALVLILLTAVIVYAKRRPAPARLGPAPRALVAELRRDVEALCAIGQRNVFVPGSLAQAAALIERELTAAKYEVERQTYRVDDQEVSNVFVEIRGTSRPDEIVVIGAHYDAVDDTIGADDNASGVAGMLALARRFAAAKPARTLRFVAFVNEEPPHFQTESMGSWRYAKRAHDRGERIVAMLSLEMLGYYRDEKGSQQYPAPLNAMYPDTANFIGFASNVGSRGLTKQCVAAFRKATKFPVESASMPEAIPGIAWSDQWSFWQFGWPAVMVTDTALFRNPHYHTPADLPGTLDYERMAHVVGGLEGVVEELAGWR